MLSSSLLRSVRPQTPSSSTTRRAKHPGLPAVFPSTRPSVNSSCAAAVFPSSSKVASYGAPKFGHTGSSENRPSSLDTGAAAPSDTPFSATKRRTVPRLGCLPATDNPLLPLYAVVASAHALALSSTFVSFINSQSLPLRSPATAPTTKPAPEVNSPEEAAAADVVAAEYYRCDKNGQIARACLDAGAGGGGGSGYGSGGGGGGEFAPSRTQRYRDL
ncbi:hypothetical protein C8F01DRAFT_1331458 [Mycena amicta]|nr:hypothetical protein C8F01DRAFT_1331458 [Mycena amicta]